ncbi:MAG: hypothetical protein HXK26_00945 [Lancefieldella rimae]|uniref:Uncharacterized protein n=1 Tax=Lancefieldella rimae TaxID=1383 RepID=A0A930VWA0_9ACTN|nr:hypothetical protein [Lancefieldella rimae]
MKRRITLLLLIIVVVMAVGVLTVPRITLFVRSYIEVQPLLERARTIMDGTADPEPSEELDGELYIWRFRKNHHRFVTHVEVTPIKVTNVAPDGSGGIILTVSFEITRYRDDGERSSWASYVDNKWYVRKNGDRWMVYKIESKP